MRILLYGCLLLALLGCAVQGAPDGRPGPQWPTLQVENRGLEPLHVYLVPNVKLGAVYPGEVRCLVIRQPMATYRLRLYRLGESEISAYLWDPWSLTGGWQLEVGTGPLVYALNGMGPADRCRGR